MDSRFRGNDKTGPLAYRLPPHTHHSSLITHHFAHHIPAGAAALCLLLLFALTPAAALAWEPAWPADLPDSQVAALAVTPADPGVVYAATPQALYRSADHGATWSEAAKQANVAALAVSATDANVVYSFLKPAERDGQPGVWRSVDGGRTWADPTNGTFASTVRQAIGGDSYYDDKPISLAVDPADDHRLLLTAATGTGQGYILRSADAGATWQQAYSPHPAMTGGSPFVAVAYHPTRPGIVYAAQMLYHGGALARSGDGGQSWQEAQIPSVPLSWPSTLAFSAADPQLLYVGFQGVMGGGLRVFGTRDEGASWTEVSQGLPQATGSDGHLALHPSEQGVLYLSLQAEQVESAGVYWLGDGGQAWQQEATDDAALQQVAALVFSPDGRWLYAGTAQGVRRQAWQPAVADVFATRYASQDGLRLLGHPLTGLTASGGLPAQYFEKGRLENHSVEVSDRNWQIMYGLLVDELHEARANLPIGGDTSTLSYAVLHALADEGHRLPPPPDFAGGVQLLNDGGAFVPFDAHLRPARGHTVPPVFWDYINRADLFPGGWLHDVGLPIAEPVQATVYKGIVKEERQIVVQAFQRTVLTYDPANPAGWQVERANVGSDYVTAFPTRLRP